MKQQLAFFESIGERMVGKKLDSQMTQKIYINSKEPVEKGLFIPIIGERFDGHDFIEEAIQNGAVAAFWQKDKKIPESIKNKITFILVQDTLKALQYTAKKFLEYVRPTVIAITGSNGKTTTKDLVFSLVRQSFRTHKTEGNYNNHIGLPLTILSMDNDCEVLIVEMGMNNIGEISFLSQLANPHYAIITNIGDSHLEQLKTRGNIAKAKLEVRDGMDDEAHLIIDGDEPLLAFTHSDKRVITCGFNEKSHVKITLLTSDEHQQVFSLNEEQTYSLPMLGEHNLACVG